MNKNLWMHIRFLMIILIKPFRKNLHIGHVRHEIYFSRQISKQNQFSMAHLKERKMRYKLAVDRLLIKRRDHYRFLGKMQKFVIFLNSKNSNNIHFSINTAIHSKIFGADIDKNMENL